MKLFRRKQPQESQPVPNDATLSPAPERGAEAPARRMRGSLARQILLTFFVLTGLSLAVAGYVVIAGIDVLGVKVRGLYGQAVDSALSSLNGDVEARRVKLDDWIASRERDLYILSIDPEIQGATELLVNSAPGSADHNAARARLNARLPLVLKPEFEEIFITTLAGEILYSTLEGTDATRVGQRLRIILDDPTRMTAFVTSPYYEPNDPYPHLLTVQPTNPPTSIRAIALLGGRLSPSKLSGIVAGRELSPEDYNPYLVTRAERSYSYVDPADNVTKIGYLTVYKATLATTATEPPEYRSTFISDTMHLLPALTDQKLSFSCQTSGQAYANFAGARVFGASCALPTLSSALLVEQPEANVLQPLYNTLLTALGLLGVLFFMVLGVSYIMTRRIVNPVTVLTEMSARVADGDFEQRARVDRDDELGVLANSFNRMTTRLREVYGGLEAMVSRRTEQLRLAADVSRTISELRDVNTLLPQVVERIRERYEFYYVGLFLLDEAGAWAVLRAGTGEPGRIMQERGHKLEVGGTSMIGWVCSHNQPRIALDVGAEAVRFSNPLLPETRSEAALPLRAGGRLVGALSVQSSRPAAFTEEDLTALQNLADQVAVAIDNAHLYSDQARRADQRRAAMDIARRASAERDVDVLLQDVCESACQTFEYYNVNIALAQGEGGTGEALIRASSIRGMGRPLIGAAVQEGEGIINAALKTGETVLVPDVMRDPRYLFDERVPSTRCEMAVPLKLGDRVIGVLDVESDRVAGLDPADQDLMQMLAGLVAVAIENSRLYQQTSNSLREMSLLYRQYTRETWQTMGTSQELGYEYAAPGVPRLPALPAPDLARAMEAEGVVTLRGDGGQGPAGEAPGRSGLAAPINLRGETIGAVVVYDAEREREWTEEEQALLESASAEVALALENARLFRQTQNLLQTEQQRRQLADTLREVAEAVSSTLKLDELLNLILDQLQRVVAFDTASVQLLEGDDLVIIGGRGFPEIDKVIGLRFPVRGDNPNYVVYERRAPYVVADTYAQYESMRLPPHDRIRSWLGVPLIYGEQMLGMLTLDSPHANYFSDEHASLALAFANQAAAAITNARLFDETQRRAQQLETLNEISRAVSAAQTFDQALEVVYQQTRRVMPVDAFFIALYDPSVQELAFELTYDQGQRYPRSVSRPGTESFMRRCFDQKRTLKILRTADELQAGLSAGSRLGDASRPSASLLYTPLLLGERAIGVLSAQSYAVNAYTQEHADLLAAIANQAAAAVQNARLFDETQRHAEQFGKLNEISRAVSSALTLDQVLETIYQHTGQLIDTEGFFIALYDRATDRFSYDLIYDRGQRFPSEVRNPEPGSNVRRAVETREAQIVLYTPDEMEERRRTQAAIGTGEVPSSLLYAPLLLGDEAIGVISTQTYKFNSYVSVDRELLAAIANQTAAAVRNVRLLEETGRRAQQLATLNEISRAVSSSLTMQQVLEIVYQQSTRVIPSDAFYVALHDWTTGTYMFELLYDNGVRYPREQTHPTQGGGLERAFYTRQPVLIQYTPEEAAQQAQVDDGFVGANRLTPSQLFVPLMLGEEAIGVISAQTYQYNSYTQEHQELLVAIAVQASAAIQNARLYDQAQHTGQRMAVLNELSRAVASVLSLDDLYPVLHEQIGRLVDANSFYVALYEPDKDEIVLPYVVDDGIRQPMARRRTSGLTGYVIQSAVPLLLRTPAEREAMVEVPMVGTPSQCYLGVPLMYGDQPIGMLAVQHYHSANVYDDDDVHMLTAVAQQAATSIQNARLFEETQRRMEEMATLNDVSRAVTSVSSLEELYKVLHQQVARLMETTSFYVALYDAPTQMVSIPYMIEEGRREPRDPRPVTRGLTGYVIRTRQALNARENVIELHQQLGIELVGASAQCWLGVPMFLGDEVLGVIAVQSYERERAFDEHHARILQSIANQAAVAIQNTRLYEASEQARHQAEERLRESVALQSVSRAVSRTLELNEVLDIILEQIIYTLGFEFSVISLVDEREGLVKAVRGVGVRPEQIAASQRPLDDRDIMADIIRTGKTEVIDHWDDRFDKEMFERERHFELTRVFTPIVSRGRNIGLVEAGFHKANRAQITESDVRLLQAFVDQAAIGIENARLFAETERRAVQLSTASEVSRAATSILDPDQLVREAVNLIRERFNFYYVAVFLLDPEGEWAVLREATGEAGRVLKERGHRLEAGGQSMVGWVTANRRARIALDVGAEAVRFANPLLPDTRSEIALPLRVGDRVVGALDAQSTQAGAFTPEDVDVLQSMADQLATTIENARLFQDSVSRAREVTALFEASQQLSMTLELEGLFDVVARRLMEATRAQAATVSEYEQDTGHIVTRASVAATPEKIVDFVGTSYVLDMYPLRRRALADVTPLAMRMDDPEHAGTQEAQLLRRAGMGALLLLPLTVRENVLGLISLYDDNPHRRFGQEEIRFAATLVNQAAVAIQNARLFAETQTALAETATLYQSGRAISAAGGSHDVLAAIMDNVAPPAIDRVVLMLFGDKRRPDGMPDEIESVAAWGPRASDLPLGRYTPETIPIIQLTNPYAPVTIDDIRIDPRIDPRSRMLLNQMKIRSMCGIPLTVASTNRWIGLLLVHTIDPHTHRFDEREVRLYHTLGAQAAVQLDRVRAEASLARRVNQLAASAEVSRAAASVLDLDSLLAQSTELIRDRFNFYHVQAFLLEEPGQSLRLRASTGQIGRRLLAGEQPAAAGPDTLLGWVVANRQARVAAGTGGDPLYRPHPLLPDMRSEVAIPLTLGDKMLGVLDIQSTDLHAFGPEDVANLSSLADQVGVAISNAQLFSESQQRIAELGLLFDVTKAATSVTRLEDVLQRSAETLHTALDRAQVGIYLRQEDELQIGATAGYATVDPEQMATRVGQGVVGWVAATGQPAVIGDVLRDSRYRQIDASVRAELAVPLLAGAQVIGVLNVESRQVEAFGQEHLRLLTTLSTTLAAVIQTARLFEEVQAANVRLTEVDRLKSEFIASMSHELRTPLNSIIGFSRVILKGIDGPLTDLQKTDLTAIHSSGQHLLGLINDILDLSKVEAGKLELAFDEVDMRDTIRGVMSSAVGLTKDKPVELRQEIPADLPAVWGDQVRLRQVVLNLVSNAAKFTDQGSITVRAEVVHEQPLQGPHGVSEVEFVRISVVDTGIGIAEKDMPKLFKQFQQVDSSSSRRAGGTGLGLNITKTLVEMHGGRIGVSSVYGQGSTFWFTVPTHPYERPAEEIVPVAVPEDERRVVLAIDDDPGVITLYKRYLEPQGYRVVGVNRSEEVMEKARELKPYVITLDVLMPHRDGWQVIQDLKQDPATNGIPVLMASIVADQGRGFSLGAADYLVKPILEQDLLAALKRLNGGEREVTVLVIDDEAANIRLVKRVLEGDANYRVLEAQGGREGLEVVQTLHPDIIVLDLMMPEVDGFDVLSALKSSAETRDIPVVVVTAKDLTQADRERLNGHVVSLLRKGPLTETELLRDVARVLERAKQQSQRPASRS